MRKAKSFWDFIEVRLHELKDGYTVRVGMKYKIWSELHGEYQEYELNEATEYESLKPYIEKGLLWVE